MPKPRKNVRRVAEETSELVIQAADRASSKAVEVIRENGLPITFARDGYLWSRSADGTLLQGKRLPHPPVRIPAGTIVRIS